MIFNWIYNEAFPELSNINKSNELLYQSLKIKFNNINAKNKETLTKSNERLYQSLKPYFNNINPNNVIYIYIYNDYKLFLK